MNKERKLIIAGNWKMNKTVAESVKLASDVVAAVKGIKNVVVAIAPTFLALAKVADPEERKRMIEPRDVYAGPVPLTGTAIAGVERDRESMGKGP
jgi:triosephosphate isomerase